MKECPPSPGCARDCECKPGFVKARFGSVERLAAQARAGEECFSGALALLHVAL